MHPTVRSRALPDHEAGTVTAELVVATPLLLLLVFGIIQFALWQHAVHVATAAAQEGARAARTQPADPHAGRDRAHGFIAQVGAEELLTDATVTATRTSARVRVEVTAHTPAILFGLDLPVRAVADSPIEQFTPDLRGSTNAEAPPGANDPPTPGTP